MRTECEVTKRVRALLGESGNDNGPIPCSFLTERDTRIAELKTCLRLLLQAYESGDYYDDTICDRAKLACKDGGE